MEERNLPPGASEPLNLPVLHPLVRAVSDEHDACCGFDKLECEHDVACGYDKGEHVSFSSSTVVFSHPSSVTTRTYSVEDGTTR